MGKESLKFYADTPSGERNILFVFRVSNYEQAIDHAAKFVQVNKFKIRAAWYINPFGRSIRIDKIQDLDTWQNSNISYHKRCISILKFKLIKH